MNCCFLEPKGCDTDGFLEKSSSIFRNFDFRDISWTYFWKIHPSIFCDNLFSFCKISVCITPRNSLNIIFRLNALFWTSFFLQFANNFSKNGSVWCLEIHKKFHESRNPGFGWVFQKTVLKKTEIIMDEFSRKGKPVRNIPGIHLKNISY